jgi:hypothetical protein
LADTLFLPPYILKGKEMTIRQAIDACNNRYPNRYNDTDKCQWLRELDVNLDVQTFDAPVQLENYYNYRAEEDKRNLLVPVGWEMIYVWWLVAQIQMADGEFDKATNAITLYNGYRDNYIEWRKNEDEELKRRSDRRIRVER